MVSNSDERKRAERASVRAQRAARPATVQQRLAAQLSARLIELVGQAGATRVTCYLPQPGEPDPSAFIDWALANGVEVLLPVSRPDRTLAWVPATSGATAVGLHGIREPVGPRLPATAAGTADLLLIPACAVDPSGTRLGWGLGYYDRCLASLDPVPPVYALVFAEDIRADLPRDPHDIPITGAITPAGTHRFPV